MLHISLNDPRFDPWPSSHKPIEQARRGGGQYPQYCNSAQNEGAFMTSPSASVAGL